MVTTLKANISDFQVAQNITSYIQDVALPAPIAKQIAWVQPSTVGVSQTFPRWNALDLSAGTLVKSEGQAAVNIALGSDGEAGIPVVIAFETTSTEEGDTGADASLVLDQSRILHCVRALYDRRDSDILAATENASRSIGDDETPMDLDMIDTLWTYYMGLNLGAAGMPALILSTGAAGEVVRALRATTQLSAAGKGSMSTAQFVCNYAGFDIWTTPNVPAVDSGFGNIATPTGAFNSGLGLVEAYDLEVKVSSNDSETNRNGTRNFVFKSAYAGLITHPDRLVQVVSR